MKKLLAVLLILATMMATFSTVAFAETRMYARNRVNVRAKACTSAKVLGVLDAGETVTVYKTGTVNGKKWVYAKTRFGKGFISKDSLAKAPSDGGCTVSKPKTFSAKVKKCLNLTALNGKCVKLQKGKTYKASRLFVCHGGNKVLIKVGKNEVLVSVKYVRKNCGGGFPHVPGTAKLKKCFGSVKKGTKVRIQSAYYGKNGKWYAETNKGVVPLAYLKR